MRNSDRHESPENETARGLYQINDLLEIMQTLRSPQGCPWDAEQTPRSLTPYIIEEACELVDAIDADATEHIRDELGDLLLQVVFQAQIFAERQQFGFAEVVDAIARKLIRRHPHVFDSEHDRNLSPEELNRQWDEIKNAEKQERRDVPALNRLPKSLPALQKAQKALNDIDKKRLNRLLSEHDLAARESTHCSCPPMTEEKLGHALLVLVYHAEQANLDAEQSLRGAILRLLT